MRARATSQHRLLLRVLAACAALLLSSCAPPAAPPPPVESSPSGAWLDVVSRGITLAEYQPRLAEGRLHLRNRAQDLTASLGPDGMDLGPTDPTASWSGHLSLAAWGRAGAEAIPGPASVSVGDCLATGEVDVEEQCLRRIELSRPDIVEWWENRPAGLEQGWTIPNAPAGTGPVSLLVDVDGLEVDLEAPGTVRLRPHTSPQTLRYGSLHAVDADGRALPSELGVDGGQITIQVDVDGATWPVVIDPILTSAAWAYAGPTASAAAGWDVAGLGDVNGDGYTDVAVTSRSYNLGTVWAFYGSSAGLSISPDWTKSGTSAYLYFGQSVDSAGDVNGDGYSDIIIGAPDCLSTCAGNLKGAALVYLGSGTGLGANPAWFVEGSSSGDRFGMSVAGAGDVNGDGYSDVVVGSPGKASNRGRITIFHGSNLGLSTIPWISIDGTVASDEFGEEVVGLGDFDGDGYSDIAASAPGMTAGSGAVTVYYGSSVGVTGLDSLSFSSGFSEAFGDGLGDAGDVNGDGYADLAVGSPNAGGSAGAAYVYYGNSARTNAGAALTVSGASGDALGSDVTGLGDLNGDGFTDLAFGAPNADTPEDGGDILIYLGSATGPVLAETLSSSQGYAHLGGSLAAAGDVNGDGFTDLIAGADGYDSGLYEGNGAAQLFLGSAAGLSNDADWSSTGNSNGAEQGFSVAGAGDVNGDGFDDVLVGAPYFDNGQTDEGRAWFFAGRAVGLATGAAWTAEPNVADTRLGWSVAGAGDVNADGYEDILVGSPGWISDNGRVQLYLGSSGATATMVRPPAIPARARSATAWTTTATAPCPRTSRIPTATVRCSARVTVTTATRPSTPGPPSCATPWTTTATASLRPPRPTTTPTASRSATATATTPRPRCTRGPPNSVMGWTTTAMGSSQPPRPTTTAMARPSAKATATTRIRSPPRG